MEEFEAVILGTIYRNDENGYSVVSVRKGRSELTVTGMLPELSPGEHVNFHGDWIEHPQYGKQLKCTSCEIRQPTTRLGIERYLGSGLIRGVGPSTAKEIVAYFGEETLTILSEHPERLQEVPKMGKKRWQMIAESFLEQQKSRQAMVFLQSYGIPINLSVKISKLYGEHAPDVIRANPYRLCEDIDGVGFQTADRIASVMGIAPESEFRIHSGIKYILRDAAGGQGHIYLPKAELLQRAGTLLRINTELCERQLASMAIRRELIAQETEGGEVRIYLPSYDSAERETAQRLIELKAAFSKQDNEYIARQIDRFEKNESITFSQRQREAITMALTNGVLVITGGPGTGKTTIINCIITLLQKEYDVLLCAPTGRAAKRMSEATGREAKTIHRLLEYSGDGDGFNRDQDNPLQTDCVIVDEMSMVDLMLMRSLLRAILPGTRLIMVGDADQLPSVGAGNVLDDILQSNVIPQCRLTDIFRQEGTSRIVVNAHRINRGMMPLLNEKNTDFFFERQGMQSNAAQSIVNLLASRLPTFLKYPAARKHAQAVRNIQVLAPAKKGACGVFTLNVMLQNALNPHQQGKPEIKYGETIFRKDDKVIQIHNDYQIEWRKKTNNGWEDGTGVFNGDVGFITEIDEEEHAVTVFFDEERQVVYSTSQLENLELAYCLSVHKSQGSEFPVVVMPVVSGPTMLLTRNLFYTALTRARSMVVLVGSEQVIAKMVTNDYILKRYTTLCERLQLTASVLLPE